MQDISTIINSLFINFGLFFLQRDNRNRALMLFGYSKQLRLFSLLS